MEYLYNLLSVSPIFKENYSAACLVLSPGYRVSVAHTLYWRFQSEGFINIGNAMAFQSSSYTFMKAHSIKLKYNASFTFGPPLQAYLAHLSASRLFHYPR